jgi:SAM-dependent methyltransferase
VRVALDFGSGDGWFTREIALAGIAEKVVPVDVKVWPGLVAPPVLFDGRSLPFQNEAFDLVFAVDVIHHCVDPRLALDELLRCSNRYFLIKDHSYQTFIGWCILSLLDELGNRRFRVPSPHHYQKDWSWDAHIASRGFTREALLSPTPCHVGPLGYCTNHLQFIALWRRVEPAIATSADIA